MEGGEGVRPRRVCGCLATQARTLERRRGVWTCWSRWMCSKQLYDSRMRTLGPIGLQNGDIPNHHSPYASLNGRQISSSAIARSDDRMVGGSFRERPKRVPVSPNMRGRLPIILTAIQRKKLGWTSSRRGQAKTSPCSRSLVRGYCRPQSVHADRYSCQAWSL